MNPDGQLHVTLCARTLHTALCAHGLATTQGLRQALSLQISWSPQSLLELQPEGGGGATNGMLRLVLQDTDEIFNHDIKPMICSVCLDVIKHNTLDSDVSLIMIL